MIIIGNVMMFIASLIMVSLGLLKTRKQVLLGQTLQIGLMVIGSIFLGSIPGVIGNLTGVVRNLMDYFKKLNRWAQIGLSIGAAIAILLFNNIGWIGLFPLLATVLYTLLMHTPNVIHLKWLMIVTNMLWATHDIFIQSYVAFAFDVFSIITCLVGIIYAGKKTKDYATVSTKPLPEIKTKF